MVTAKEVKRPARKAWVALVEKRATLLRLVDCVIQLAYEPVEIIILEICARLFPDEDCICGSHRLIPGTGPAHEPALIGPDKAYRSGVRLQLLQDEAGDILAPLGRKL